MALMPGFWKCLGTSWAARWGGSWGGVCGCGFIAHPGRPLGAPSADNTEALLCWGGGGQGGVPREEKKTKERTTNLGWVSATLGASIPQPPSWLRKFPLPTHQSQFSLPLPNISTAGQRHREAGVVCVSHLVPGVSESLG